MPDFYSQLDPNAPMTGFHTALVSLYDSLLQNENVPQSTKDILARLRAHTHIQLNGL